MTTLGPTGRQRLVLVLDAVHPPSWNKFYAGKHHSVRQEAATTARWEVVQALQALPEAWQPFTRPVNIYITAYAKDRRVILDSDNVVDKIYIDALKRAGVIVDDDPKHVKWTATQSALDRDNPRLEIVIEEAS